MHFELVLMACVLHHMWASPSLSLYKYVCMYIYIYTLYKDMFMHVCVFLSEVLHDQGGLFFAMLLTEVVHWIFFTR